ncbi:TPA: hypothetical protein ACNVX4_005935 [Pseudomonas aeruginosa]|uniref:hypothetical protein n=1 Tax=Pseudomonas aeruginosa TaxID=287 RepID=UPI0024B3C9D0|nr:hypothetical protein [Pseudomonas aeruginosa]MDS9918382.1 hypothetical protein [Pseudomonas aeruginosa]CAI9794755.1 hypothetical protein PAER4782_34220 [Pseudomonas aeruginosa]CAI9912144.1 hypothetical protein PAER4782_34220 [Pseudomonas aeruginosa]HBO9386121.1 hypothetical protein [Pseudomonas aeruginosa]HCF2940935.1 hypothetical protein [Pseudomonas aeruginosa]
MPNHSASNPRIRNLIGNDFTITTFSALDLDIQASVAWLMSNDGGAWSDAFSPSEMLFEQFKESYSQFQKAFIKAYGCERLGFVTLDAKALMECVMQDPDVEDAETWEEAAEILMSYFPDEAVPDTSFPVILFDDEDQTLQDGWPRLCRNLQAGAQKIEAMFFPDSFGL